MERSLEGRTILVTGGSRGTGLAIVLDLHQAGADVIVGTRSQENYFKVVKELQNNDPLIDGERVHPFIADITQAYQTNKALDSLINHEYLLTDVVHAAAGGMESFARKLGLGLARLARVDAGERDEAFGRFVEETAQWVEEGMELAKSVNYLGPRHLTKSLKDRLPEGGKVIDLSSLYTTFFGRVWVPAFYRGIASTKDMYERWLEKESGLEAAGVNTIIVSGHIIKDTDVGQAFTRFIVPLLPKGQQESMLATFIQKEDMVKATRMALAEEGFSPNEYHRRLYVYGPGGQITTELSPTSEVFAYSLPL